MLGGGAANPPRYAVTRLMERARSITLNHSVLDDADAVVAQHSAVRPQLVDEATGVGHRTDHERAALRKSANPSSVNSMPAPGSGPGADAKISSSGTT